MKKSTSAVNSPAGLRQRLSSVYLTIPDFSRLSGVPERTLYSWMPASGQGHPPHKSALRLLRLIEKNRTIVAMLEEIASE